MRGYNRSSYIFNTATQLTIISIFSFLFFSFFFFEAVFFLAQKDRIKPGKYIGGLSPSEVEDLLFHVHL